MAANFANQSTDSENSKLRTECKSAGNEPSLISQKSAQAIAQERTNLGGYEGGGGENPGASITKGVAKNA